MLNEGSFAPADLPKYGTWLDLPLAIILLQAAGYLPDLPDHKEGDFVLMGEIGIHGEVRRVPGALSLAYRAKPGQSLIVPSGNEKECALILAKPGHEGCGVFPVSTLDEVIDFFKGKKSLDNALTEKIAFEPAFDKAAAVGGAHRRCIASRLVGDVALACCDVATLYLSSPALASMRRDGRVVL